MQAEFELTNLSLLTDIEGKIIYFYFFQTISWEICFRIKYYKLIEIHPFKNVLHSPPCQRQMPDSGQKFNLSLFSDAQKQMINDSQ